MKCSAFLQHTLMSLLYTYRKCTFYPPSFDWAIRVHDGIAVPLEVFELATYKKLNPTGKVVVAPLFVHFLWKGSSYCSTPDSSSVQLHTGPFGQVGVESTLSYLVYWRALSHFSSPCTCSGETICENGTSSPSSRTLISMQPYVLANPTEISSIQPSPTCMTATRLSPIMSEGHYEKSC